MLSEQDQTKFWANVEKTSTCWNWTGATRYDGYGRVYVGSAKHYVHRIAWELTNGPIPDGKYLDHKCHNTSCVNPQHLRPVTAKENAEHLTGSYKNSKTGIRGVFWNKGKQKYTARVAHNKKIHHAGYFADIKDAEAAAVAKRLELFTHNDADRAAS